MSKPKGLKGLLNNFLEHFIWFVKKLVERVFITKNKYECTNIIKLATQIKLNMQIPVNIRSDSGSLCDKKAYKKLFSVLSLVLQ